MANKSIRIRTTPGESKNIQVKIEQDFDFLEILSLKITQEELYRSFCSDYGVVIGRVISNNGFGIPNAKISVFIPITDEDEKNELIKDLYPFKTPQTQDSRGYRYNLLLTKATCELNKAVGTFPTKEEVLNNEIILEIFEKYYKYTTRTNDSGDYILFGVPTGQQTIHIDLDMSDMGLLSVRPYELISEGMPKKLFESSVEYKTSNDLDSLIQIKSQNKGTDVVPFWGDPEQCQVGITRVDFNTGIELQPKAIFTGSIFTDNAKESISQSCKPTKKMGSQCELKTGSGRIEILRIVEDADGNPAAIETFEVEGGDLIDGDGVFAFPLPMYLDKVITDEFGNLVPTPDPDKGIPTTGRYRFKMNFVGAPSAPKRRTASMIFPSLGTRYGGTPGTEQQRWTADITQYDDANQTNVANYTVLGGDNTNTSVNIPNATNAGQQTVPRPKTVKGDLDLDFHKMEWKQIYSISSMIKKYKKGGNRWSFIGMKGVDECGDINVLPFNTAVRKFDILFWLMIFILDFLEKMIRFLIILCNITICCYFRVGFSICIAGACASFCIVDCTRILNVRPFKPLGDLIGCLDLPCGDNTYQTCITCPKGLCTCACTAASVAMGECETNDGCSKPCCPDSDNDCSTEKTCFSFAIILPDENTCASLNTLEEWKCCVTYELAIQRKVIRLSLLDAWVTGTAYLFQFKYKRRQKPNGIVDDSFCGPGSNTRKGSQFAEQYAETKNCSDGGCLILGPSDKLTDWNYVGGSNGSSGTQFFGLFGWANPPIMAGSGSCLQQSCNSPGLPNGANDSNDFIYCNSLYSTRIVSLGSVELCEDVLYKLEKCIFDNNCMIEDFKLGPKTNDYSNAPNPSFGGVGATGGLIQTKLGTGGESGFDRVEQTGQLNISSYQDPREVFIWLLRTTNCRLGKLFLGGGTFSGLCHEKELKFFSFNYIKEVSKVQNKVVTIPYLTNPNNPASGVEVLDISGLEPETPGPFNVSGDLLFRWNPQIPDNVAMDLNYQTPNNPMLSNGPYFYFGLTPGKTALERLRRDYFLFN